MVTPTHLCTVCKKPATSVCASCADGRDAAGNHLTPTRYCGRDCQKADWPFRQQPCRDTQPSIKLSRAGQLLQDCFLGTRAEAFDLRVTSVERAQDGGIHFFDEPADGVGPISPTLFKDVATKNAVLSWGAGRDVFAGLMFNLAIQAFAGRHIVGIEEMDVRMFKSRILTYRHHANDPSTPVSDNVHHILRVTLKDKSVWAVDVAGAQPGQHNPVVFFADYDRDSIAKILDTRSFGTNARNIHVPVLARNPGGLLLAMQLEESFSHQRDELVEWVYHHVTIPELLKSKREEYLSHKTQLVARLATQAREYVKLTQGYPSSSAKLIVVRNHGIEDMSDEDKGRMKRKGIRMLAGMDDETRRQWLEQEANGTGLVML